MHYSYTNTYNEQSLYIAINHVAKLWYGWVAQMVDSTSGFILLCQFVQISSKLPTKQYNLPHTSVELSIAFHHHVCTSLNEYSKPNAESNQSYIFTDDSGKKCRVYWRLDIILAQSILHTAACFSLPQTSYFIQQQCDTQQYLQQLKR